MIKLRPSTPLTLLVAMGLSVAPLYAADDDSSAPATGAQLTPAQMRERQKEIDKKLTRAELSRAKDDLDIRMDNLKKILTVLKSIRESDNDSVADGRDALKRLMPDSNETYRRMAGEDVDADDEEGEGEEDLSKTVAEIRAERAADQVMQKEQKKYDKLVEYIEKEMERIDESDVQSYELSLMLEKLEDLL